MGHEGLLRGRCFSGEVQEGGRAEPEGAGRLLPREEGGGQTSQHLPRLQLEQGRVWLGAGGAQGRRDTRKKCSGKAATERSQHQHGAESAWEQQPGTGGTRGVAPTGGWRPHSTPRGDGEGRGGSGAAPEPKLHAAGRRQRTTSLCCSGRTARGGSAHHQNPKIKHQKKGKPVHLELHHPTIKPPPSSRCSPLRTRGPHSLPAAPPALPPP